jgi:hypothetical protein
MHTLLGFKTVLLSKYNLDSQKLIIFINTIAPSFFPQHHHADAVFFYQRRVQEDRQAYYFKTLEKFYTYTKFKDSSVDMFLYGTVFMPIKCEIFNNKATSCIGGTFGN